MISPHPEPPPDLAGRKLPIWRFRGPWYRIHRRTFGPLYFDRSAGGRFNAPRGDFGVLYVGRSERCAFIETLGRATGVREFEPNELAERRLARVRCSRPLRLVDLRDTGLARIGADGLLTNGSDYGLAHRWSKALHEHPRRPDGIAWRARHDHGETNAALFDDRVSESELSCRDLGALDSDPVRLAGWLDAYDFGLLPSRRAGP